MALLPCLLATLLMPPPVEALFGNITLSDFWDDFNNNMASDLTPLVSLFGEQVTKQFLTESIYLLDSVLFSIAPLGILTVLVSVIRVCGGSLLKSVIGRAREPHGLAEVELCSSTSQDVCELWSNGGICRVFGRPKILEFLIYGTIKSEDLYPDFRNGRPNGQPKCGIEFTKNILGPLDSKSGQGQTQEPLLRVGSGFGDWQEVTPDYPSWGASFRKWTNLIIIGKRKGRKEEIEGLKEKSEQEEQAEEASGAEGKEIHHSTTQFSAAGLDYSSPHQNLSHTGPADDTRFAIYPNLALNIARDSSTRVELELRIACIFGTLLQASFLVYTTWATWFHSSFYDGDVNRGLLPFFVLCISGTLVLQFGTWLSSLLIDFNSEERRFINQDKDNGPLIYWLQPGGQRVGDQEFSAFAYSERAKEYITSWKVVDESCQVSGIFVWLAIAFSILGWIAQFIGIRGLHSTVALYQLACTIIMSIIRAFVRRNTLEEDTNFLKKFGNHVEGHELDWLAHTITNGQQNSHSNCATGWLPNRSPRLANTVPEPYMSMHDALDASASQILSLKAEIASDLIDSLNYEIFTRSDGGFVGLQNVGGNDGLELFERACRTVMTTIESEGKSGEFSLKRNLGDPFNTERSLSMSGVPNLSSFTMRIRSKLAYMTSESTQAPDQVWNAAIRKAATQLKFCIQRSAEYIFSDSQILSSKNDHDAIFWTAVCKQRDPYSPIARDHLICFAMFKENGKLKIDLNSLEAAISLLYYSMKREAHEINQMHVEHKTFRKKRFVLERHNKSDINRMLEYWMPTRNYVREEVPSTVDKSNLSIPTTLQFLRGKSQKVHANCEMITMKASSTILQLIAQDIFTIFIDKVALLIDKMLHELTLRPIELVESTTLISSGLRGLMNRHIETLIGILVSTEVATREEALMTIIPSLFKRGKLSGVYSLMSNLIFQANSFKREHKFRESEKIIRGLLDLRLPALKVRLVYSLCELYRTESQWINNRKELSPSDIEWKYQEMMYGISTEEGADISNTEETEWIKAHYRRKIYKLFDPKINTNLVIIRDTTPPEIQEDLNDENFEKLTLDNLRGKEERLSEALGFFDRFSLIRSSKCIRLQVLRWAIEFGCLGLVEDIVAEEKRHNLESVFIGDSDELFWAIAGRKIHPTTVDIVEFLIGVASFNVRKPLNGERGDKDQVQKERSQLVMKAWEKSRSRNYMKGQYDEFGSVLAAAAARASNTDMVRLLVEKGHADIIQCLDSGAHGNALAAALYGGSTDTFKYLLDSYSKEEERLNNVFFGYPTDHLGTKFKVGRFGNLLIAASYWGRVDCIELIWIAERKFRSDRKRRGRQSRTASPSPQRSNPTSRRSSFHCSQADFAPGEITRGRGRTIDQKDAEAVPITGERKRGLSMDRGLSGDRASHRDKEPETNGFLGVNDDGGFCQNISEADVAYARSRSLSPHSNLWDRFSYMDWPKHRLKASDVVPYGEFETAMAAARANLLGEDKKWADETFQHDKIAVIAILESWMEEEKEEEEEGQESEESEDSRGSQPDSPIVDIHT